MKPLKKNKTNLALNTQVKIIKSLNRFLAFCFTKGWMQGLPKCEGYDREDTETVTADDIFREEEIPLIRNALRQIRPISEEFFVVLLNSSLRENEGLGLSLDFITEGRLDGPRTSRIHDYLKKYDLDDYYGYICLESQPAKRSIRIAEELTDRFGITWNLGSVPRKPFEML